jgi:hypothetical protein
MKKWMTAIMMVLLAAGISTAAEPGVKDRDSAQQRVKGERKERQRPKLTEEQRAEMKTHYEEVHALAETARAEADPVKKAELTEQLRAKLTEGAQEMQERFLQRVEQAEAKLEKMKERLAEGEKNMEQRVDEHLQKLLSGEQPERKGRPEEGKPRKDRTPAE